MVQAKKRKRRKLMFEKGLKSKLAEEKMPENKRDKPDFRKKIFPRPESQHRALGGPRKGRRWTRWRLMGNNCGFEDK